MADPKNPKKPALSPKLPVQAAAAGKEPAEEPKKGMLGWVLGWVVVPGLVLGSLVAFGAHLGANEPDAWYTRAVLWAVDLF